MNKIIAALSSGMGCLLKGVCNQTYQREANIHPLSSVSKQRYNHTNHSAIMNDNSYVRVEPQPIRVNIVWIKNKRGLMHLPCLVSMKASYNICNNWDIEKNNK